MSISRTGRDSPSGPCHSQSIAIESRVIPASGPVISLSSSRIAVDQGRLAGIGAADDGELERAFGLFLLVVFVALDMRPQMLEQVDDAVAMLGAHRDRLAEAERPGLEDSGLAGAAFGLVGGENDRGGLAAQPAADLLVERGEAGARVDQEQCRVRLAHRGDGLGAHPARQGLGILVLVAGGVDDPEVEPEQARLAFAAVARDSGPVVDQRKLAAHQPVEQGRLADIGPADDRDGGKLGHGGAGCGAYASGGQPSRTLSL